MAFLAILSALVAFLSVTPRAAADLVSADGFTTLSTQSTIGTVTPGTPYSSGQTITATVTANSSLSNATLCESQYAALNQICGNPTGFYYIEECTDPGGLATNLPTTPNGCEHGTEDESQPKSMDGSLVDQAVLVYDLPAATVLGPPNMTGKCDVAPNQCVIGIFAADPQSGGGFSYPHLFSAPFNIVVGDGLAMGDDPGDGSPPPLASTSATNSTVAASPTTVVGDGANRSTITVTLKDTNGNPVTSGKSVTLAAGSGSSTIAVNGTAGSTEMTDDQGQAVFTVTDDTAESVTYTAMDSTDSLTVTQTAAVTFSPPAPSIANSSIGAASTTLPQTGSTTITVTLKDQGAAPQPIAGKVISLSQGSGSSTIAPASSGSDTTNAQGQATFTVSDSTPETVTYTATDSTDNDVLSGLSVSVTFGTLTVSASQSTIATTTPIVATSGSGVSQTTGTVDVTLLDGTSPVAGKSVTLSASGTAQITPSSQTTGSNGVATFTVSDPTVETATFHAVDSSDGNLSLTATTQVSFQLPAVSASRSSIAESPAMVPADGVSAAGIVVTIEDQFGNPQQNKAVTVTGVVSGTSNASNTARVNPSQDSQGVVITTTNSSGQITFDGNDTTAESITYTATDTSDNVTVTATASVTFVSTAVEVSQSSVQANPTSAPADGTSSSTVTVSLADHNNNPVSGVMVGLAALNGSSVITPDTASGVATDSEGDATFKVTDTTAEIVRYRATDITDDLPLVGEEVQVTFGTPTPTPPALNDSDITASTTTVPADGKSSATVQVLLNDGNGLPLASKTVSLVPTSLSAVVAPLTAVTDATGAASFTVTDKKAESVTFAATDITDNLPLAGLSVTVTFTPSTSSGAATTQGPTPTLNKPVVGMAATPDGNGYWLVASDGGIFNYGDAAFYGSAGSLQLNKPIVGMAATPDGNGYWLVASDGGIFDYGDAAFEGSTGSLQLNKPIVGMAATPDGKGYWLVASDGGIFNYGDAAFYGSAGSLQLNKPIVGMAATPDGKGYWLVASDGGIFDYGDAAFYGSAGSLQLNKPIVGMAATPDGKGYWLVASDGGIFNYGDSAFEGSTGSLQLNKPIVGMAATPDGKGYWLVASDGGIFTYGDATFDGSLVG